MWFAKHHRQTGSETDSGGGRSIGGRATVAVGTVALAVAMGIGRSGLLVAEVEMLRMH